MKEWSEEVKTHSSVCLCVCLSVCLPHHSYLSGGVVSFSLVKVDHETPFHKMVAEHQPALHSQRDRHPSTEHEANNITTKKQYLSKVEVK